MMKNLKMQLMNCLRNWKRKNRNILQSDNTRNINWLPEMYALSDFLIMVYVMVSEAVT